MSSTADTFDDTVAGELMTTEDASRLLGIVPRVYLVLAHAPSCLCLS
jgi:hypothetical protein